MEVKWCVNPLRSKLIILKLSSFPLSIPPSFNLSKESHISFPSFPPFPPPSHVAPWRHKISLYMIKWLSVPVITLCWLHNSCLSDRVVRGREGYTKTRLGSLQVGFPGNWLGYGTLDEGWWWLTKADERWRRLTKAEEGWRRLVFSIGLVMHDNDDDYTSDIFFLTLLPFVMQRYIL